MGGIRRQDIGFVGVEHAQGAGIQAVVCDSHNPAERVWRMIRNPDESRSLVEVVSS